MKILLLSALLLAAPGGDREDGLAHYAAGRYAEAAAAFRRAIESEGDAADLQYNLALASWRAGELGVAETAVEKYAALAAAVRPELHAGLLGGVRFDEAKALEAGAFAAMQPVPEPQAGQPAPAQDPLPMLQQARTKAQQARDHFVRGAAQGRSPELLRNLERTLRYLEELERKIEELEKQRSEQQDEEQQNQDQQKSEDEPKDGEQNKSEPNEEQQGEGEKGEQEKGKPKPDEQQPESEQGAEPPPEPEQQPQEKNKPDQGQENQPGEQPPPEQPEPQEGEREEKQPEPPPAEQPAEPQPRNDAPGERAEGRELSPEQAQRLLEQLQDLDKKLKQLRALGRSGRKKVGRDW